MELPPTVNAPFLAGRFGGAVPSPHMPRGVVVALRSGASRAAFDLSFLSAEGGLIHTWSGIWRLNGIHRMVRGASPPEVCTSRQAVKTVIKYLRNENDGELNYMKVFMQGCGLDSAVHERVFLSIMTISFPTVLVLI